VTQSGFIRISSNPKIFQPVRTPLEALALLADITDLSGHHFWEDRVNLCRSRHIESARIVGYHQATDAHLLAIALEHDGMLATFDRAIPGLAAPLLRGRVEVIDG